MSREITIIQIHGRNILPGRHFLPSFNIGGFIVDSFNILYHNVAALYHYNGPPIFDQKRTTRSTSDLQDMTIGEFCKLGDLFMMRRRKIHRE